MTNITSPVNGTVVAIEPDNKNYKVYIKVDKSNFNFFAPINGFVVLKEYQNGLNLEPLTYKGMQLNNHIFFKIAELDIEIYSGMYSPKLKIIEKYVKKHEEMGIVLDGLVILHLPYKPQVELNMEVEAKTTIL